MGNKSLDFEDYSGQELLALHNNVAQELRRRNITRSANNPTGDVAELLFCRAFNWTQEGNSKKGYDALDGAIRYQIKGRRLNQGKGSRQLSALRDIDGKHFDYVGAILFNMDYTVWRAAIIPYDIIRANVRRSPHTNSHLFFLGDQFWDEPNVRDVTEELRKVNL